MTTDLGAIPSVTTIVGVIIGFVIALTVASLIASRPQRGILLLAAMVPYDGLLLLVPAPGVVNGWKEGLVLITLVASLLSPKAVPIRSIRLPAWGVIAGLLLAYAVVQATLVPILQGAQALKIGYFYLLIPLILLRNPLDGKQRDLLVTILMVNGVITALYGLAQQIIGPTGLAALGYEYNETIRTAGGFLRSFSTFNQPFAFGLFIMMVLLVGGAVALSDPRRWRNLVFLLTTPILVGAMSVSIVRGAYLGLAVGVLLLGVFRYRGLFLLLPAGVAVLLNLPASVLAAVFSSSSLNDRSTGWGNIFEDVLHHPFGIGIGTTGSVAEKVALVTKSREPFYQPDSHYVKMLLELGVIGAWLLIMLLATALVFALTQARRNPDPDGALALGIAASVAAAVAASAVSTYFEIFPMDVFFWLLLGVVTCLPGSGSTHSHCDPEVVASRPTSAGCSTLWPAVTNST